MTDDCIIHTFNKQCVLFFIQEMTVDQFMKRVSEKINLPEGSVDLMFCGKYLRSQKNLNFFIEHCLLRNGSTVVLCLKLVGGFSL